MATYDLRSNIPSPSSLQAGDILNAPYNNQTFSITLPKGTFQMEVWGAGSADRQANGGYAIGSLLLLENTVAYVVPGSSGGQHINGGNGNGGDASDVRLLSNSINNRVLVAGGGGGLGLYGSLLINGGYGGGTTGGDGAKIRTNDTAAGGGSATAGGVGGHADAGNPYAAEATDGTAGTFGSGGYPDGGGGWYGGGGRFWRNYPEGYEAYGCGAGGGSGFALTSSSVANVPSSYASTLKVAKYYLTDTQLISGNASMPNPSGGTMTGNASDGYVRITVLDTTPRLSAPTNLAYSNLAANSVTISWTAPAALSGVTYSYKVYRGTALLTTTTSTSFNDSGISPGGTYTYKVITTAAGYTDSTAATLAVTNRSMLSTPTGLTASYTLTSTTITWNAVANASKYKVWRGTTYIGEQTARTYTDSTNGGKGTSNTYKISAVPSSSNYYESAQATITTSNPQQLATPTNLSASYTQTSTTITWNAVSGATAYSVWRGSTLLTTTNTTRSYTDSSSYGGYGHTNTYKVSATASNNYESAQASITASNGGKLATPTGLTASYTSTSTTISWNAVTHATAYKVSRDGGTAVTVTTTSYADTSNAGAGKNHTYTIIATGASYYDSDSATINTSNQPQLTRPTNLSASYTRTSTTITWDKVDNATAYNVWRGGTNLGSVTQQPGVQRVSFTDTSTLAYSGKSYIYKISATASGYWESPQTNIQTNNPPTLATPTGMTASYTQSNTTITWNAVANATSYLVYRGGSLVSTQSGTSYTDTGAGSGSSVTYSVVARNSPAYYDSDAATFTSNNPSKLSTPANVTATQTVSSVKLQWSAVANATSYTIKRGSATLKTVTTTTYTDTTTQPGNTYSYSIVAKASGFYDSDAAAKSITIKSRYPTPSIVEAYQDQNSVTLSIMRQFTSGTVVLLRNGVQIASKAQNDAWVYTDTNVVSKQSYVYSVYTTGGSTYYDSIAATITVYVGKDYTNIERQRTYLQALTHPFFKLCRLRFLYPNGTTAFALDNNRKNRRSKAFIADGTVNANMQNGQRLTATVTIANANKEFDFAYNKIWFGQEISLDEGILLPNGEEYWRQTGVFVIDNPQERVNPNNRTVTYNLVDKWADLDGTLDGNLEGTHEVAVNTNIFNPVAALLSEDRGNGRPVDRVAPVFTEYFNSRTQDLPDGTTASMVLSPYTLTIDGDGGTIGAVVLGLGAMVNAWVGYDNTGRLRMEPSQDDILDAQKAVLYRFRPEEVTLLGLTYTIKKEDVYNDYIVVGEQFDDYSQPGGRAQNLDPRSDTNVHIIGRKTKRESASGFATVQQCVDLAAWRLKRSGILQKAVNISCSQMFHLELNSLVEIVRTDKEGSPTERHLIQGYSRPLTHSGAMTISAVSVNDFPIATITQWPPA